MAETEHNALAAPGGMHPRLALFFAQLEDVRKYFKKKAEGMTVEELDREPVEGVMSPGKLLAHSAGAEDWWIQGLVVGNEEGIDEKEEAMGAGGKSVDELFEYMDGVRDRTRKALEGLGEADLSREFVYENEEGKRWTFTLEWILHHLVEHEAHHRGQFALLKRMLTG